MNTSSYELEKAMRTPPGILKYELGIRGYTFTLIANELKIPQPAVSNAVGHSIHVYERICSILKTDPSSQLDRAA